MNNLKKILFFFSLVTICIQSALGYVHNQTKSGTAVHWSSASPTVDIFVNSANTQGLDESVVQSIANNSVQQWNGISQVYLRKNTTTSTNQSNVNELYFSSDPSVFNGSGVIGVTLVSYKEENGEILEADVLVNDVTTDMFDFSVVSTEQNYLGNVITHELGHFLGLGHGQVVGSTMFYALSKGQYQVADDDKAGLYSTYPNSNSQMGTLSGTIVGGKSLALVFGAHVQALSVKTGKVMGSALSEINGKFKIDGLPINDQYLIYTSPIKQLGLPTNYANIKNNFCEASKSYRGSFFQSCGASAEGFPEAISLNSSSVNVGNITIRCGLDVPPNYFQNKSVTPNDFDLNSHGALGLGGSFVGFFSNSEMQSSITADHFRLNFSQVDWNSISPTANLYVELKISNQIFNSVFKGIVNVKRKSSNFTVSPDFQQEADGRINIDTVSRFAINRADSSENDFEIKITPESADSSNFQSGIPYSKDIVFPDYTELQDSLYFYLATATIVKDNGDGTFTQLSSKSDILSDNTQCPDAVNTYSLTNYSANGTSSTSSRKSGAGCGTVDDTGNSNGGGPGGFMLGLILSFIMASAISRYSKLT